MSEASAEIPLLQRISEKLRATFGPRHPEGQPPPPLPLERYLLDAARSEKLVADYQLPPRIDLGSFGYRLEQLERLSLSEQGHREYATLVGIDRSGRLFLSEALPGEGSGFTIPKSFNMRLAAVMHSHAHVDMPFSSTDLNRLLRPPNARRAVPAELVVTPTTKLVMLRTPSTPQLSDDEMDDVLYAFDTYDVRDELELEHAELLKQYGTTDTLEQPQLTPEYKQAMAALSHKRMYVLTRIAHDYHLALYSCPIDRSVALRVS